MAYEAFVDVYTGKVTGPKEIDGILHGGGPFLEDHNTTVRILCEASDLELATLIVDEEYDKFVKTPLSQMPRNQQGPENWRQVGQR